MQRRRFFTSLGWLAAAASSQRVWAGAPNTEHGLDLTATAAPSPLPVPAPAYASDALRAALKHIDAIDRRGPRLNSIIELNPNERMERMRPPSSQRWPGPIRAIP
jgi:amidase